MIKAPKDRKANALYREKLLAAAADDESLRDELWIQCSRDLIFFIDSFAFTFSPKDYPNCPERAFILYEYQDDAITRMDAAIGGKGKKDKGHDLLIAKSRDVGASWLMMVTLLWRWMFKSRQTFLIVSRKEDLVDRRGDPDSLMWKLDFLLEHLPGWMVPAYTRNNLKFVNEENHSTINGESANEDLSRGGRRTAIVLDEFAAIENGHSVLAASRGATNCRLFNSTPKGAYGAYYEHYRKMLMETPEQVLRLHWTLHPERRVGLYSTEGNKEGGRLKILDADFSFPAEYKFILDGKIRSPYYDAECLRAGSPQEIAQELDIDFAGSGWQFFDRGVLEGLIQKYCMRPYHRGEITDYVHNKPQWTEFGGGRLLLWTNPDPEGLHDARRKYVIGCDIATGKGGEMSSNSVASIVDKLTGEKVGEFATNSLIPFEFCEYVVGLCKWFNDAFLIWEENGPGGEFTQRLKELKYRNVFYREDEGKFQRKKSRSPGWWTTKESKRALLSSYFHALVGGKFVNRSKEALEETGEYVHQPNGDIVHNRAVGGRDPTATGAEHGDRCIADALAFRGLSDVSPMSQSDLQEIPPNSAMARRNAAKKRDKAKSFY